MVRTMQEIYSKNFTSSKSYKLDTNKLLYRLIAKTHTAKKYCIENRTNYTCYHCVVKFFCKTIKNL